MVVLVLDELPLASLLDEQRRLDAVRYPNFAALARESTWYRDTTSVHADTNYAVPAILDARMPRPRHLPVVRDHPKSLFALLAGRYRLHVHEEATQICPLAFCSSRGPLRVGGGPSTPGRNVRVLTRAGKGAVIEPHARRRRVLSNLGMSRPKRFRDWVAGIAPGRAPQLDFFHLMMPHVPFQFMPSGRTYNLPGGGDVRGLLGERSYHDPWLVHETWQRHLLQVGAVDELLGELVGQLKRGGLWDDSLVVVMADHGMSFRRHRNRRDLRPYNVGELAPVPLFVKAPRQKGGRISDAPRQTIDVMPTIADLLHVGIPWRVDGSSALRRPPRRTRRMVATHFNSFAVDRPVFRRQRQAVLRRQLGLFGSGTWGGGLYGIGPLPRLLGRRLNGFKVARARRARLPVRGARWFRGVAPETGFVPTHVQGLIRHGRPGGGRPLAVAVNGTIFATAYSFSLRGSRAEYVSVVLPENVFRRGRNRLQVLEIGRRGLLTTLADIR